MLPWLPDYNGNVSGPAPALIRTGLIPASVSGDKGAASHDLHEFRWREPPALPSPTPRVAVDLCAVTLHIFNNFLADLLVVGHQLGHVVNTQTSASRSAAVIVRLHVILILTQS